MRLVTRRDTSLAVALIVGTLIAFERPFRWLLDLVHDVEQRYHIDLLPALTLLTVVFVFHQYRNRLQAKSEVSALAAEVSHARARAEELERHLSLGRSMADALDRHSLEQALWRTLPAFVGSRECSVLTRHQAGFEFVLRDVRMMRRYTADELEAQVAAAARLAVTDANLGVETSGDLCFTMCAGETPVGAIIVRNEPPMSREQRLSLGAAAAVIGITARNARLLYEAQRSGMRDALTGCITRAHAMESLDRELRRAHRSNRPVSIVMFDLDEFKLINDQYGHLRGDAVLAAVGEQLNQILRSTDLRARYGGDEFLVILPDTPILGAQQVAECLRRQIAAGASDADLRVTVSLGVACAIPGERDAKALVSRADAALYRAKLGGRDRWCASAATPAAESVEASAGASA